MTPAQVRDADILLVRSVTHVDAQLLAGSNVQFVGSATIGFDHVDRAYLQQSGIGFSTAPGKQCHLGCRVCRQCTAGTHGAARV